MIQVMYGRSSSMNEVLQTAAHAAEWFAARLGLGDARIIVRFEHSLAFYASAACGLDDVGNLHIMISPLVDDDPVVMVAHEIVHCHQIWRGDLVTDTVTGDIYWQGQRWNAQPGTPNEDCPWEIEAYGLQAPLSEQYWNAQRELGWTRRA